MCQHMGDDSSAPFGSSSVESLPSNFTKNVEAWVNDGQPILNDLLQSLHEGEFIKEPMVETFVFTIVGGYSYNFSKAVREGMSVGDAHSHAMTLLIQNPKMESMTEAFMQNTVAGHVSKVVE